MTSEPSGHQSQIGSALESALGRRTFLRRAAIGVGAVAATALVPTVGRLAGGDETAATAAQVEPNSTSPMVVYVRDAARGEAVIMAGTTESVVVDAALVRTLMHVQDRHLT